MARLAGRRRSLTGALLLLAVLLGSPAFAQEPPPSGQTQGPPPESVPPAEPAAPIPFQPALPVGPQGQPIPVIPETQFVPPSTISSAPERFLSFPSGIALSATFQFAPTLTLSEEYTDNFNLSDRNKQGNFRSTVSPGLRLLINGAFTKGIIGYTFSPAHDTIDDEIRYFHSLLGQVTWEIHPQWRITVADTLTRSDQPTQANSLGLRNVRQTFTSNTLSLSSDHQIGTVVTREAYVTSIFSDDVNETTTHRLSATAALPIFTTNTVSAGYDYLFSRSTGGGSSNVNVVGNLGSGSNVNVVSNQFVTSGDSETSGHQFTLGVSRKLSTLRTIGVRGSYALRTVSDSTGDSDFNLWNVGAFTNYTLPGLLTLNGSVGISGLTNRFGQSLGPNFFTTSSLSYQLARAVLSLQANQGFSETFANGQNFGVVETTGYTGSLSYPFTPFLSGMASGTYQRSKTTGVGNTAGGQGNETESWGGSLAFTLQLRPGLRLGLTYSYLNQTGGGGGVVGIVNTGQFVTTTNGYTENRVRASVDMAF